MASSTGLVIPKVRAPEGGGVTVLARVRGSDGSLISPGAISSVQLEVYEFSDQDNSLHSSSLSVGDVVFSGLRDDALWTKDSRGYNFAAPVPASAFSKGDTLYRIEFLFAPTDGEVFYVLAEIQAENVYGE